MAAALAAAAVAASALLSACSSRPAPPDAPAAAAPAADSPAADSPAADPTADPATDPATDPTPDPTGPPGGTEPASDPANATAAGSEPAGSAGATGPADPAGGAALADGEAGPVAGEAGPVAGVDPLAGAWYQQKPGFPMATDDAAARERKVVLLTFDDGPHPEYTPMILDTLRAYNVKALWFVTGKAKQYPDLVQRIHAEGHQIGTHTLYHENLKAMTLDQQRAAILPVNAAVEELTGEPVRFFRPPFGAYNDDTRQIMAENGLELVNWSHGSCDWCDVQKGYKDPAEVVADVLAEKPRQAGRTRLHPGAIILMHDTLRHTAEALPEMIEGLRAAGYEFVLLSPKP